LQSKNLKFKSKAALSGFTNYANSFGQRDAVSFGGVKITIRLTLIPDIESIYGKVEIGQESK